MTPETAQQLAVDIAANVVKATAVTTARDLEIQKLQLNYQAMFDTNTKEHSSINESLERMATKLDQLIDKMDGRYAKAWTEKALIWVFSVAGVAVIGLVIRFVITYKLY